MRFLEILLLIGNLLLLIWCFYKRGLSWGPLVSHAALAVLAFHCVFEGCRWQMLPAYLATVLLFASYSWPAVPKPGPWLGVLVMAFLMGTAAMGTIMPVFSFPTPTGPFVIGSTTRHLIDRARTETQGNRQGEPRELMVKIWYPAEHTGTRDIYRAGTPQTLLNHHLRLVKLHSYAGVPLANAPPRFPIVIVSPAWTGTCGQYVFLTEELASHGFIVVGIDHPYGSHQTIFPDGRIIDSVLDGGPDFSSDEALEASVHRLEAQLAIRTADVRFVLDELERLDAHDPHGLLTGRLDLSRVAACGHSFGGAVAADVCLADARFKAGINLDGLLHGAARSKHIGKPFLFISDEEVIPSQETIKLFDDHARRYWTFISRNVQQIRTSMNGCPGNWLAVRGAKHMNFHDRALYTPLTRLTDTGSIRPMRAMEISNAYIVAFLQTYLNGEHDSLLDAPSPRYPEVEFERIVQD